MAVESTLSQNIDSRDGGGVDPRKKLRKRRSIRVSRVPSLKPSSRRSKSIFNWPSTDLSSDASSQQQGSQIALSDSSPNYMESNGSFYLKKESSQASSPSGRLGIFAQSDSSELLKTLNNRVGSSENDANFEDKPNRNIPSNMLRNLSSSDFAEGKKDNSVTSLASDSHTMQDVSVVLEEKNRNLEPDRVLTKGFTPGGCSEAEFQNPIGNSEPAPPLEVQKPLLNKGKSISMWQLIHKHMVSDLVATDATKPLQTADETDTDTAKECSNLSPKSPISKVDIDNHEIANQEIEIRKLFAIKLVREAIEKILLPELQDQSSESQSITSDNVEDHELSEKNHQEGCNNGRTNSSGLGNTPSDPRALADTDRSISKEEKKSETMSGKKSDKKSPNSWSNLKKWILLQRFIKELEKVRKFKCQKSQHKQLDKDPEAEEVNLRHQTVDERKRSEEWMVDYALQQVVSQLAPTQKRKVALLVKAFETVVPPQEEYNFQVTIPKLQDKCDENAYVTDRVDLSASEMGSTMSKTEKNITFQPDDWERSSVCKENPRTKALNRPAADGIESSTTPCLKSNTVVNSLHEEVSVNKECQQRVNGRNISSLKTENFIIKSPYTTQNITFDVDVKSTAAQEVLSVPDEITMENIKTSEEEENGRRESEEEQKNLQDMQKDTGLSLISKLFSGETVLSSKSTDLGDGDGKADEPLNTSQSVLVDKIPETMEDAANSTLMHQARTGKETIREPKPKPVIVQEFNPMDLKTLYNENKACESQLERKNYIRMWHIVYQHVASSIATRVGGQLLGREDEEVGDVNTSPVTDNLHHQEEFSERNPNGGNENHQASHQQSEFSRTDTVKLVQEAVDEILLPEILDDTSDTQSVTSETIPYQDLSEKEQSEVGKESILNSPSHNEKPTRELDMSENGFSMAEEEKGFKHDNFTSQDQKKAEFSDKKKTDPPKLKNWSKLKKFMLLKRSIKAMEKARKLKSQPKQYFPLPSGPESEKIDLRHQMTDERRKAEQWMLDYAVQHIVAELTPARKRRVAMLVEAFEAVVPLPEL